MEKTYLITCSSKYTHSIKYYTITCSLENLRKIFASVVKSEETLVNVESLEHLKSYSDWVSLEIIEQLAIREGLTRYIHFSKSESKWVITYYMEPNFKIMNLLYDTKAKILYMKQSDINNKKYYRNLIMDNYFIKEKNITDAIYNIRSDSNIINILPLIDLCTTGSKNKIFLILDSLLPLNNFMSVFRDMNKIPGLVVLMSENNLLYEVNYLNNEIRIKRI